jgi:hypothetical protein
MKSFLIMLCVVMTLGGCTITKTIPEETFIATHEAPDPLPEPDSPTLESCDVDDATWYDCVLVARVNYLAILKYAGELLHVIRSFNDSLESPPADTPPPHSP